MHPSAARKSSWLAEALAGATVLSGVGYLVTAYSVSRWLTRPSRGLPRPTPAELGFAFEDIECHTADGHRLAGWVIAPPRPRGTVVLFHGLRHNRAQTLPRVPWLIEAGYRCVTFDHRAHGKSSGRCSSFGFHESRDVAAILGFVERRWPQGPRAAVGISMGAAALCFSGEHCHGLSACVLESLYHDVASAFDNRIGTKFPRWFRRFSRGVIWVTERRLGLQLHQITPADHIARLAPVPLLLVTGSADVHAPPTDSERLRARCGGKSELAVIDGADHTNLPSHGGDTYQRLMLGFLERHLCSSCSAAKPQAA
jgi:alpha-beta hydrolase superfamily lysophospholipase